LKTQAEKPVESLEIDSITKQNVSDTGANNFFDMLVESYRINDEASMIELITNLSKENGIWFSQAYESLFVCKYPSQFAQVGTHLMNSIMDRHNRYAIAAQANYEDEQGTMLLLSQLKQEIGTNAYYFSSFNPTGRYRLNLNIEVQRNIAKNLLVMNKKMYAMVKAKEIVDKSQIGN
jgi:hypothetical protein